MREGVNQSEQTRTSRINGEVPEGHQGFSREMVKLRAKHNFRGREEKQDGTVDWLRHIQSEEQGSTYGPQSADRR